MKLNGTLMSGDTVVANIINARLTIVNEQLLPLFLKNYSDIDSWLIGRAIDKHRTNSRLLKKALRLTTADDIDIVLKVNASTITDNYWFKQVGSVLTYNDIKFKENMFDKLALLGDPDSFNNEISSTPELTNIGSFEKCWRLIDHQWWLYKQGNALEIFSELFIYQFGKALGFCMAHYEQDGKHIRSLDFTNGATINFELANGIVGEDEDYNLNFTKLKLLSDKCSKAYVEMIFLDTICFNMDRHTKNYGVMRDIKTGEVLALAPNFDNNIVLIARGYPKDATRKNDKLIALFIEFIKNNDEALIHFKNLNDSLINKKLILNVLDSIQIEVNRDFICDFILNAKEQIDMALQ
ncbi:MAG: hypothetical protein H7Y41_06985 [Hyphomonadaceae bacterium]|nr:hypothetical protein [Clostridia bacterium]